MNEYCVITTINSPTQAIEKLYEKFGNNLIVVGDLKTPDGWEYKGIKANVEATKRYAPDNHYARKNLGYLRAIREGADCILDIDDDTYPNDNYKLKSKETNACKSTSKGWFNIYEPMTTNHIWPRGFPLSKVISGKWSLGSKNKFVSSIQQCLIDGEPDVDAIYRLVINKKNEFKSEKSIYLDRLAWCPFNSQATWFFPDAYPLMYLPTTATFRMCDIWRSFIAQRCLWELEQGVTFHSPSEFIQERNEHNLMDDFIDEIPGYLLNDKIVEILGALTLKQGEEFVCENMLVCYHALVGNGILPEKEIDSLKQWIKDYEYIKGTLQ